MIAGIQEMISQARSFLVIGHRHPLTNSSKGHAAIRVLLPFSCIREKTELNMTHNQLTFPQNILCILSSGLNQKISYNSKYLFKYTYQYISTTIETHIGFVLFLEYQKHPWDFMCTYFLVHLLNKFTLFSIYN